MPSLHRPARAIVTAARFAQARCNISKFIAKSKRQKKVRAPCNRREADWHYLHVADNAAYIEDLLLVDRCQGGEQAAARELFRLQHRRVQATLYRILGSNRDMDDLLQETFIQVFGSLKHFRGESRLSTWIDRIAVRVAYRYLARKRTAVLTVELVDEPAGLQAETSRRAVAREGVRRFYAALAEMSPQSRVAFVLHDVEGRSMSEVAEALGASHTATKVRVWRARRSLYRKAAEDPILREFLSEEARLAMREDAAREELA